MIVSDLDNIAYNMFANCEITLAEYIKYQNRDKIMNYEEKYKQALERARKELQEYVHKDCDDMTRRTAITIIHNLFPELKESEDERIRKELIEQVAYIIPDNYEVDSEGDALPTYQKRIDKYRAWLERQGKTLDPDKVIEWLKNEFDDSTYGKAMIERFKKDFGL